MKKITILFLLLGFLGFAQVTTTPSPAVATGPVTLNFDKAGTGLSTYSGIIYAHIGLKVNDQVWQFVKGNWGDNTTQPALTPVSGTTYKLELTPDLFTYFGVPTTSTISQICVVFRSADATMQTTDIFVNVGAFQVNLTAPAQNSTTVINSGGNLAIAANNTGGNASYTLKANGVIINTNAATSNYSYNHTNITANQNYELTVTQGTSTVTKKFSAIVNPGTLSAALPDGARDGITYNTADATKATLVLNAPGKDFVYVAGSFNNWQPTSAYAMKKDPTSGKFWLELTGLTSGTVNTFQYWVVDQTPTTGSQAMVKTADPFSTLVLSPYDDQYITADVYPNLPAYPAGQDFEVSVLQTGQQPYNWQATNFVRPAKEDLVIYELLVRDFNTQKTWASLTDQIDYFKNLHINAIEVMPVMEFEGNISWGYNTAFHMANDKAYGTADAMKAFIDTCHENGIAVILDVALNHVYGRSPLARLWANDPDGDGYGNIATDNPYCNTEAKHSYSVGNDLNHQSLLTQYYVERTIEHWMTEFNIDGFRWDLTKGFTQECTPSDETCTNAYHADRVAILKHYSDTQWAIDPDFYVIFEHLGTGSGANSSRAEEIEWANYKADEGKGIMLWGNFNGAYNQNSMGYAENSNFNEIDFENRSFNKPRLVGYAESHDEERLMYKNLLYGANFGGYDVKNLATALNRSKAVGAMLLTVPGPKMIWQFGELGYDFGINYCENGTYSNDCRTNPKPVPSEIGYTTDAARMGIYYAWSDINNIRMNNDVFHTTTFTVASGNLTPRVDIWKESLPDTDLKYVIVLANFTTSAQTVNTNFPANISDTWYNLLTEETMVASTTTVTLQPGSYILLGNKQAIMGAENFASAKVLMYPNPASNNFGMNIATTKTAIYTITGQLVKTYGPQQENYSYDISGLSKGLYLITVTDTNNRQSTLKLVKE